MTGRGNADPGPPVHRALTLGVGVAGAAAAIAGITLAARLVGFGRWLVYSREVSALCVGNVYSAANQVPNVLFEVVAGGALAGAVVPVLAGPLARAGGRAEADRIGSALLTWTVLLLTPVAVLLAVAARPLAGLLVDDTACPGGSDLATALLRVFAPQVVLYGIGIVLTGILQARHRFLGPALGPLLSSLTVIGAYLAFGATVGAARDTPADLPAAAQAFLGWGTTAGVLVMTLPLLWPALRSGARLRPTLRFPPGVAARVLALAGAGIAVLIAQQASVVTVLVLAQHRGNTATLNVFQYTQAVYVLPYAVAAVPLATAAFPRLAAAAARGDLAGFAATAAATTRVVLVIAAAGAAGLVAVASPVAGFFAGLDRARVDTIGPTLTAMAPGLVGFALIAHIGRALYALERGRAAAVATVSGWVVAVVMMVVLSARVSDGRVAVALGAAGSIGMTVAGLGLVWALRRHAGPAALSGLARTAAVTALAGLSGGWVGHRVAVGIGAALPGSPSAGGTDWGSSGQGWPVLAGLAGGAACLGVVTLITRLLDRDVATLLLRRGLRGPRADARRPGVGQDDPDR